MLPLEMSAPVRQAMRVFEDGTAQNDAKRAQDSANQHADNNDFLDIFCHISPSKFLSVVVRDVS